MNETPSLLDCALAYAGRGRLVFPVGLDKRPLTEHGFKDATDDPATIEAWWTRHPDAGIGSPVPDGQIILDVDPRNGGHLSFDALTKRLGPLPPTVALITGGGGPHLSFLWNGAPVPATLAPGIDIKAAGKGYTILPPTVHESGGVYTWIEGCAPAEQKVAELPEAWRLEIERANGHKGGAPPLPPEIPAGRRNEMLTSLAGVPAPPRRFGGGDPRRPPRREQTLPTAARRGGTPERRPERRAIRTDGGRPGGTSGPTSETRDGSPPATSTGSPRDVPTMGWLHYDGARWAGDETGEAERAAKETVEAIFDEALREPDEERRKKLRSWALTSQGASRIRGMLELARTELPLVLADSRLDTDPNS